MILSLYGGNMLGTTLITIGTIGLTFMLIAEDVKFTNSYTVDRDVIKRTVDKLIPNDTVIYYIDSEEVLEESLKSFRGHLTIKEVKAVSDRYYKDGCCGCSFKDSNLAVIFLNAIKYGHGDIFEVANLLYKTVIHEIVHIVYNTPDETFVRNKTSELMESADLPFPFRHI